MKTLKKITGILMCVLLLAALMLPVLASSAVQTEKGKNNSTMEAIISEYHNKNRELDIAKAHNDKVGNRSYSFETYENEKNQVLCNSVSQLRSAGYEAYGVTSDNFDEMEKLLQTNFLDMGMTPESNFIAIVHGEEVANGPQTRETASNDFYYTYNGTTYIMRYLTLTAADNSAYGKVTSFDVDGSALSIFNNILNVAISAVLDHITLGLGSIYSIASPDWLSKYETQNRTLYLDCATNWTRTFTQVWSSDEGTWVYGAMVEQAKMAMILYGTAYNEDLDRYASVTETQSFETENSDHYLDPVWQKQKAAQCMTTGVQSIDATGSIKYYATEGNRQKVLCTHNESF